MEFQDRERTEIYAGKAREATRKYYEKEEGKETE